MSKANKVQPRLPRGFNDRDKAEIPASNAMMDRIRAVYELYGFEAVETPFFEFTEALGKFLPDTDRPNAGVFSLVDDDGQWLSLRYDLTAPLARYVAENFAALPKPYRSYRAGYVFRNEKPGPGRFRQFMQFDADTVGAAGVAADAEICMMAADCMEAVGIQRGQYVIRVNNRKVLDGIMQAIGLGGESNAERRLVVLRAIDKFDRLGVKGVEALLGEGRKDESGDYTKGAGLGLEEINILLRECHFIEGALGPDGFSPQDSGVWREGVTELEQIEKLVGAAGYGDGRVMIDLSVVRGLEYYTGPVYEAELTFEVKSEDGRRISFGSVGGGGRYDGLIARFREEPVPATGFSVGVSRLQAALTALNGTLAARPQRGPVVVLAMDRDLQSLISYQQIVASLRQAGVRAELYLGQSSMKAQLKYADRRDAACVVIQGSDERQRGEILIRDLIIGAELATRPKDGDDRQDYLARQADAQFAVKREDLVEGVRKVLNRHI